MGLVVRRGARVDDGARGLGAVSGESSLEINMGTRGRRFREIAAFNAKGVVYLVHLADFSGFGLVTQGTEHGRPVLCHNHPCCTVWAHLLQVYGSIARYSF